MDCLLGSLYRIGQGTHQIRLGDDPDQTLALIDDRNVVMSPLREQGNKVHHVLFRTSDLHGARHDALHLGRLLATPYYQGTQALAKPLV